jgi:hypothetical protein
LENRDPDEHAIIYWQINYALTQAPDDAAYFHAQFRRTNPLPLKEDYVILDGIQGKGQYVGTYMAWGVNNSGWWGEGEIKFFIDGDEFPTICGTGTEDYFCGAYNFDAGTVRPVLSRVHEEASEVAGLQRRGFPISGGFPRIPSPCRNRLLDRGRPYARMRFRRSP